MKKLDDLRVDCPFFKVVGLLVRSTKKEEGFLCFYPEKQLLSTFS